ncbi:hypothetical protein EKO04_010175 [Ascochyta lentis]|uniref:tRNA(His) guanylyltransferase n=1 Tax=Ascochyta lentis TaxID=205686 RepID=A0A8H7IU67_9PLEO|nr:hypothetical protein EKO04_010175 [Ascochyta lentis]
MANSKYEYVRSFEQPDVLLSNTWIVVRIDGRGFSKLTTKYKFVKPNDRDALDLMNEAAQAVMRELPDLVIAYVLSSTKTACCLSEEQGVKLTTTIVSTFTSYYVFLWSKYFPQKPLTPPLPSFDGRAVCYPSDANLRDYMSWRQVDCHINNLYNTTFWTLVQQGGMGPQEAEQRLSGTVSADKNEILFKEYGINYNNEPECFKKGTILYRDFFTTNVQAIQTTTTNNTSGSIIAQPQPARAQSRTLSQSNDPTISRLQESPILPLFSAPPGPTFLSTSSTPSPPSSLRKPSEDYPNPLRSNPVSPRTTVYPQNFLPMSPPSTITSPMSKPNFSSLTPLPLSPPILRPSTKPPMSLDAPNPTTRSNFSPAASSAEFIETFAERNRSHSTVKPTSHSASASMSVSGPLQPNLKHRSPSLSQIHTYLASSNQAPGPPSIPLRISSIPANTKPRKLSLQNFRSTSNLKAIGGDERENRAYSQGSITPSRASPPLNTNKELPSPPVGERRVVSDPDKRDGNGRCQDDHPGIAELPATSVRHFRQQSHPVSPAAEWGSYAQLYDKLQSSVPSARSAAETEGQSILSSRDAARSRSGAPDKSNARSDTQKSKDVLKSSSTKKDVVLAGKEASGGRPTHMSRTQKEKDRKKRSKAKILTEHVDLIKDEFWEKRPWILSGKTG